MSVTRTLRVVTGADGVAKALELPRFRLKVVKGADKKREATFDRVPVMVGSGPGADFKLSDAAVSALHCELHADEDGFKVRDLGSKNGVWLGGRRAASAWLTEKDELVVGQTTLRFEVLKESSEQALAERTSFGRLIGSSVAMRAVYAQLERVAATELSVLLLGETGTGKELAAEALVEHSARREKPLVVVDCGRLPVTLAESELFGHERGAFTGATSSFAGAFERANGGTLFLDEVGDLPRELQPKLLGVLERREVQRLGASAPVPVDVRVIAATHRELPVEVNRGTFRADLFYRLAVAVIRMPPLRARVEDVNELIGHFLAGAQLPAAGLRRLADAEYPGNVRELRAAVERAVHGLLPEAAARPAGVMPVTLDVPWRAQKEALVAGLEREYLTKLLEACGGNITEASRRSGINRVHIHELIRRLGVIARKS
ncbi:MAG: sigma 54-dependent Fis family transcriptional regulator [Myxococcaceae bacterium]|nr:sigma 54-dependent Fis family transcriptional regulator [Myxococcaceae bacterium]